MNSGITFSLLVSGAALTRLRSDTMSLMSGQHLGHDRGPAVVDRGPTLSVALAQLHLQGAIVLRGEYTEAWAYDSLPPKDAATVLAPGTERLILFHVIASGRAWIQTSDSERHWASAGGRRCPACRSSAGVRFRCTFEVRRGQAVGFA
jgi:hypothetical protein